MAGVRGLFMLISLALTVTAFADAPTSEAEAKKFLQEKLSTAKTPDQFADALPLGKPKREAVKAWAKKNGVTNMPSIKVKGSDVIFELNGQKAKLTVTDFKRTRLNLNDRLYQPGDMENVEVFLNETLKHLANKTSAGLSWFVETAYAEDATKAALALASGATAMSYLCWGNKGCQLAEAMADSHNLIFKELKCKVKTDPNDDADLATVLKLQMQGDRGEYYEYTLTTNSYRATLGDRANHGGRAQVQVIQTEYGKDPVYITELSDVPRSATIIPEQYEKIMKLAVQCCGIKTCEADVNKQVADLRQRKQIRAPIKVNR